MTNLVRLSDKELDTINSTLCVHLSNLRLSPANSVPKEVQELYEKLLEVRYGSHSS